ncbi:MAG: acyltransferase family protein, partial [Kiritimatiellia bacterium]
PEVSLGKLALVTLICCVIIPITPSLDIRGWVETNPLNGPVWSLQWEYLANILYALFIRRFSRKMLMLFVACSAGLTLNLTLNRDLFRLFSVRDYAAYTVIGGWSLTPDQLVVGISRLLYPFFAGLLLVRLRWICPFEASGIPLTAGLLATSLAMPYFAPAGFPMANGLYEAGVILALFPLIVAIGAGTQPTSHRAIEVCKFLGELSYPLYLTHFPFVYLQKAWVMNHPAATVGQHAAVGLGAFLVSIGLSCLVLKYYDSPVRNWLIRTWLK